MNVTILKSKLHNAVVTGTNNHYEGSIVVDEALMEEVGLIPFEKVLVANSNTGDRFETYVIKGARGSGAIELNGATARLGSTGDRVIIFAFAAMPEAEAQVYSPKIVLLDENNQVVRRSFAA
ncbi:MAG: aspartate 1-decarboxylase [Candidatus Latescibacterota bacterium]|nr:MAG: aspartate 1-decarboxylase [Candidatus Latescibacterota bacterium]